MKKNSLIKGILILVAIVVFGFGVMKIFNSFSSTPTGYIIQDTTQTGEVKEFNVVAYQWGFEPSTITVNKGDSVRIISTSKDAPHSFTINEYGINLYLDGLSPKTVEFIANKAGTFTYYCSVPCGAGHSRMKGKFIVKG